LARRHGTRWRKKKAWHGRKRQKHHQKNKSKSPRARKASIFTRPQRSAPPAHLPQGETQHHCIPQSRNGPDIPANIRWKPSKVHVAWHILFANLRPDEVVRLIKANSLEKILYHNGPGRHYENRKWAWDMVFTSKGATSTEEYVHIVQQDWTPPGLSGPTR